MRKRRASDPEFAARDRAYSREYLKAYRKTEKHKASKLQSYRKHADRINARLKAIRASESPEARKIRLARHKAYRAAWKARHPGRQNLLSREYRKRNPEKMAIYERRSYEKIGRLRRQQQLERDENLRLKCKLSNRIRDALRGTSIKRCGRTLNLVGCTIAELKQHLEAQFKPGMTWKNCGRGGWHIDHKIPCAEFDLRSEFQQLQCFHFSNLQPLWEKQNLSKGSRVTEPYQKTLSL